ncbi:MAG: response regulator [Pirellulales bacterium]
MKTKCKRVLVAEDNFVLSQVLKFNLERAGYAVEVAANGSAAARRLAAEPFDLLITDYQMPQMNGDELCRVARHDLGLSGMPIVLCSAKGLEIDVEGMLAEYDITQLFFKPFSMKEIVSLVDAVLGTSVAVAQGA